MNKLLITTFILTTAACATLAQPGPRDPAPTPEPRVAARGPHHRVWEYVVWEEDPNGELSPRTNSFTELATGMHVFREGQWREASPELEITETGARAAKAQHSLQFLGNLRAPGAVTITTPEGQVLRTSVLGISYQDASGKAVFIAETKDSRGEILPVGNQALYPDAFDGIEADLLYVSEIHGVEQLVIFRGKLPDPREWSLEPASTMVQVISEFLDRPAVQVTRRLTRAGPDDHVRFSGMELGKGEAFALGSEQNRIRVTKQWVNLGGRACLVEQLPFEQIAPLLKDLPGDSGGSASLKSDRTVRMANDPRRLPAPRIGKTVAAPLRMAKADLGGKGFVLDFTLLTSQTNLTLHAAAYYYVSGTVNVTSNLTVEGNVVVKFTNSPAATIIASNVIWKTTDWAPAVFTSKDDNSVGDLYVPVPGSTGDPTTKYYAGVALDFSGVSSPVISNARFSYLSNAVGGDDITFENVQLLNCYRGVAPGAGSATLRNVLIHRVDTFLGGDSQGGDVVTAENLTVHYCTNFVSDTARETHLTNSLLVCATNWSGTGTTTNCTAVLNSDSGIFSTVGAGTHYLAGAGDSPYRNAGTSEINEALLKNLRHRTTYPPLVYSNVTISANTTFYPQAQRDTDAIDLGYHFWPLDHVFGGVTANANLTFAPGTAAGWFRTTSGWQHAGHGIHLADQKVATFDGRVDAPCYWVRYNTVQEGGPGVWAGGYGPGGITGWAATRALAPQVVARFLRCSVLGGEFGAGNHFRDDWGYLLVYSRDSEFWGGQLGGYVCAQYHTNSLLMRAPVWLAGGAADNHFIFRNCTFYGGSISINRYSGTRTTVQVRDSALDWTAFPTADSLAYDPTVSDYDYNAVIYGAPRLTNSGANLVIVTNGYNWQAGPLGFFYLPTNSTLINNGSVSDAALAGLYHYTTTTNLVNNLQVKEQNTRLDIGFHFVAVDGSGKPIDSDGDGIADVLEDVNGNGLGTDDPCSWTNYNSANGLSAGSGLQVFTPVK